MPQLPLHTTPTKWRRGEAPATVAATVAGKTAISLRTALPRLHARVVIAFIAANPVTRRENVLNSTADRQQLAPPPHLWTLRSYLLAPPAVPLPSLSSTHTATSNTSWSAPGTCTAETSGRSGPRWRTRKTTKVASRRSATRPPSRPPSGCGGSYSPRKGCPSKKSVQDLCTIVSSNLHRTIIKLRWLQRSSTVPVKVIIYDR